jgi:hypothetical protein
MHFPDGPARSNVHIRAMWLTTRSTAVRGTLAPLALMLGLVGACSKIPPSDDVAPIPGNVFPAAIGSTMGPGTPAPGPNDVPPIDPAARDASPVPAPAIPDAGSVDLAPAPDVTPSDASPAPPVTACASGSVCFDFEDGTAGQGPGAPWSGRGAIDGTRPFSGKSSLRVNAGDDNAFATLGAPFFPVAGNEYFGRVMAWTAEVPSARWTFIKSRGRSVEKGFQAEYTYGGSGKKIIANYDTPGGPSSDCSKNGGEFPVGKWVCMEWHFKGASNEMELWIDGVADGARVVGGQGDSCVGNGTDKIWYAPTFNDLQLGYAIYSGGSGSRSVWFDDLALSASGRIGCPAPAP